jgi:hypothetical protein
VAHDRTVPASEARIVIKLARGKPDPQGELSVVGEAYRSFTGWIGLISALESALNSRPARNPRAGLGGRLRPGETTADGG